MLAAQSIQLGINDVVVAGGMENMSNVPKYFTEARKGSRLGHDSLVDGMLKDGLTDVYNDCGMGVCAEICAENHKITREDQYDVYGNLFGLLASHPIAPLVTLHHLDVVEPIFPNVTRVQALQRLTVPMKLDSAGLMQQSICYDKANSWTISVSWGFAVQIFRRVLSPREMEMPSRTFLNWYKRADYTAYAFLNCKEPMPKTFCVLFVNCQNGSFQQPNSEPVFSSSSSSSSMQMEDDRPC
ncbi:uncharacterized protein [Solanum lycopersicum]|uniref:uncharacterized protein n=1 Tax=Solanum lycopersicum TaxID=4081 RepID=UPI0037493F91